MQSDEHVEQNGGNTTMETTTSAVFVVCKMSEVKCTPFSSRKSPRRSELSSPGVLCDGSSNGDINRDSKLDANTVDITSNITELIGSGSRNESSTSENPTEASIKKMQRRQLLKNRTLKCTACVAGNDAEFVHAILSIPICGSCNKNVLDQSYPIAESGQELRCTWCGDGTKKLSLFFAIYSYFTVTNSFNMPYQICMACIY